MVPLKWLQEELIKLGKVKRPQKTIYAKLLAKAVHALAEVGIIVKFSSMYIYTSYNGVVRVNS